VAPTIRCLTSDDDLEAFGRLVVGAYDALPDHPADPGYHDELADVAGRVRDAVVIGAFDDTTPLGCVTYVSDARNPYAERLRDGEASFRMLAVSPAAQGRGIGEALVQACLERARSEGRSAVFVYTGPWMPTAHRLYRRLGFVPVPERDWDVPELFTLLGYRCAL
jgi:ribosomal protein S18 acetylase RimI-like enzyme